MTFAWASQNSRIYIVHSNMAPKLYEIAKHTTEDSYCWVKSRLRREIKVESSSVKWVSNSLLVISHQSHSRHTTATHPCKLYWEGSCLSTFDSYLFWYMMLGIKMFLFTLNILSTTKDLAVRMWRHIYWDVVVDKIWELCWHDWWSPVLVLFPVFIKLYTTDFGNWIFLFNFVKIFSKW